jgi:hypothetical protein
MKLYDIRTALKNLVHINKDLDKDRLTTLLEAAGWDTTDIKDAILLWETNSFDDADTTSTSADIIVKEDMTPVNEVLDNSTTIFANTDVSKEVLSDTVQQHSEESIKENEETINHTDLDAPSEIEKTPDDIKVSEETKVGSEEGTPVKEEPKGEPITPPSVFDYVPKVTPHTELPHNLPLRPYESSFVTVPLNEYEKRFASHTHSKIDAMPQPESGGQVITYQPAPVADTPKQVLIPQYPKDEALRVTKVIEAPLETEDKYLAFIAIILFVLIMFILGYMHIIGRI